MITALDGFYKAIPIQLMSEKSYSVNEYLAILTRAANTIIGPLSRIPVFIQPLRTDISWGSYKEIRYDINPLLIHILSGSMNITLICLKGRLKLI